ncbi:MAG: DUF3160 domain-containing protein [bacterium]
MRRHGIQLVIVLGLLLPAATVIAGEGYLQLPTLADYLDALEQAPDNDRRSKIVYGVIDAIEKSSITVDPTGAERLALALTAVAVDEQMGGTRYAAWGFLTTNAHPATADAVVDFLGETEPSGGIFYKEAATVLVNLRDSRVLPFLLDRLSAPRTYNQQEVIRFLAELGDPRALDPLQTLADDEQLAWKFTTWMHQSWPQQDQPPTELNPQAVRQAQEEQAAARRAIREIQLFLEHDMVCHFDLDDFAHEKLARNGFVILPQQQNELFEFYGEEYPYITADIIFHTFMVMMRASFHELETLILQGEVGGFTRDLMLASIAQGADLKMASWTNLIHQNSALLAVPTVLCGAVSTQDLVLPERWSDLVQQEIDRITAAAGVLQSEVLGHQEDYTEYVPRGRHSGKPELAGYFKAMMWLGRSMLPVESPEATTRALLLLDLLEQDRELATRWENLDRLLGLFFGERDDLAFPDYLAVAHRVAGEKTGPVARGILMSDSLGDEFRLGLAHFPPSRINSAYVPWSESMAWQERTRGLRLLGQRYTRDAHLFQSLLEAEIWPPSGLHVAAELLGSEQARTVLANDHWPQDDPLPSLPPSTDPVSTLSEGHLHCFSSLFEPESGTPDFMLRPAWEERLVNSALGGWAEVRHATALYVKSAHEYMGLSGMMDRFHGYVDPYPRFYSRLDSLVQRLDRALNQCGLYTALDADLSRYHAELEAEYGPRDERGHYPRVPMDDWRQQYNQELGAMRLERAMLNEFSGILQQLEVIAHKALLGQPQNIDDGVFLKNLGRRLRILSFNRSSMNVAEEPMSTIIDVATEYQRGECLEVGVGRPLPIYVAVPDGDRTFVCKGAVYTYYEFTWPVAHRLTDDQWWVAATRIDGLGTPPWIATRPELGLERTLSRSELDSLRFHLGDNERNGKDQKPWDIPEYRDITRHLQGVRITPDDLDLLLELARKTNLKGGTRALVYDCLTGFAQEPSIYSYFQALADSLPVTQKAGFFSWPDMIELNALLIAFGHAGEMALPDLEQLQEYLESMPGRYIDHHMANIIRHYYQTLVDLAIIQACGG